MVKKYTKTTFRLYRKRQRKAAIFARTAAILLLASGIYVGGHKVESQYLPLIKNNIQQGNIIASQVKKSNFEVKSPTVIQDVNGKDLKTITSLNNANSYIPLKNINPLLKKGLVQVEDKRFYEHHGVDIFGTLRAVAVNKLGNNVQGGSTLTQQLVKNTVLHDQSQTYDRKLKEMVIAQQLEKRYSKDKILEFYLNNISYNHSNLGINAAAKYYFGKDQKDLAPAECAMLIGLINNPVAFDPQSNPNLALKKRNQILKIWKHSKLLNEHDYQAAINSPLNLHITPAKINTDVSHDYALSYAVNKATIAMMHNNGFTEEYWWANQRDKNNYLIRYNRAYNLAREQLLKGGYVIHTNIDANKQNALQNIVDQTMGNATSDPNQLETSISVIDNSTGQIVGIQGGRNAQLDAVNRGYLGYHQPGSTAKMLIAYPEAFERGWRPQSKIIDSAIPNGPKNWYAGYRGAMTIREAVAQSVNTPAFKLAKEDTSFDYINKLRKMEFDNLSPLDANPIIAIGGFTYGVTTTQMASGYSALTRGGNFISPTSVTKITEGDRTVYQNTENKVPVFTPEASYMSLDVMKSVMTGNGLGKEARLSNYPYVAGKTGTTDNNQDSYFVGMTPQYTIAVWVGYDKSGHELTQSQLDLSKTLFKKVGEYYSVGQPKVDFAKPSNVIKQGDYLYASKNKNNSIDDSVDSEAKQDISNRALQNQKRRDSLAYRIKYHLTLKQEKYREDRVKNLLAKIDTNFSNKENLKKYQTYLRQAQDQNIYVRRQEQKDLLNKQILQKQMDLNKRYSELVAIEQAKQTKKIQQAQNKVTDKIKEENRIKASKLQDKLKEEISDLKSAYQNDAGDKNDKEKQVIDTINQIRALGIDEPDVDLTILEK